MTDNTRQIINSSVSRCVKYNRKINAKDMEYLSTSDLLKTECDNDSEFAQTLLEYDRCLTVEKRLKSSQAIFDSKTEYKSETLKTRQRMVKENKLFFLNDKFVGRDEQTKKFHLFGDNVSEIKDPKILDKIQTEWDMIHKEKISKKAIIQKVTPRK